MIVETRKKIKWLCMKEFLRGDYLLFSSMNPTNHFLAISASDIFSLVVFCKVVWKNRVDCHGKTEEDVAISII